MNTNIKKIAYIIITILSIISYPFTYSNNLEFIKILPPSVQTKIEIDRMAEGYFIENTEREMRDGPPGSGTGEGGAVGVEVPSGEVPIAFFSLVILIYMIIKMQKRTRLKSWIF